MLTKESILEAFFNIKQVDIEEYIANCPKIFDAKPFQPLNFEYNFNDKSSSAEDKINNHTSKNKSISSEFSQITVNKTNFDEIFKNKTKHNVFTTLSINKEKNWYFSENQSIKGPFTASQMNDFFKLGKFTANTSIKDTVYNNEFYSLTFFVLRYYKRVLADNIKTTSNQKNHEKYTQYGTRTCTDFDIESDNMKSNNRGKRVLSHAIIPNLYFLDNILEEPDSSDEIIVTRNRSSTADYR